MLYQQGAHNGSNMGERMHSYPIYQEYPAARRAAGRSAVPPADRGLGQHRQPDRTRSRPRWCRATTSRCSASQPAVGRVFNSKEDDQVYQGHPVVVLSYDYWVRRFARDPAVVGKKILVNNYPMTIVGVSAAGFAGLDPARSPQIRVPIQMKPAVVPDVGLGAHGRSARALGAGVRAAEAGLDGRNRREAPLQGLFTQIRAHEMTLPGAKDWSGLRARAVHEGTAARRVARPAASRACATTSRRR